MIEEPQGKLAWALTDARGGRAAGSSSRGRSTSAPRRRAVLDARHPRRRAGRARASTARSSSARCSGSCTRPPSRTRSSCRTRVAYGLTAGLHTQNPADLGTLARPRPGRQPLRQPRHHRCDRAAPALRRVEALVGRRRREGGRTELPHRTRLVASVGGGDRVGDAAPARARLAHHGRHRSRAAVARLRGVRVAAPRRPVGRARLGSRVRPGASDVSHLGVERNLFRYRPVVRRGPGDGGCRVAGAPARRASPRVRGGCGLHAVSAPGRAARRRCAARSATSASPCSSRATRSGSSG